MTPKKHKLDPLMVKAPLLPWAIHTDTIEIHGPLVSITPTKKPNYKNNRFLRNLLKTHGWDNLIDGIPLGSRMDSLNLIYDPAPFDIPKRIKTLHAGFSFRVEHIPSKESPLFPDLKMENGVPLEIIGVVTLSIFREAKGMRITVETWPIPRTTIERRFTGEALFTIPGYLQEKIRKQLTEDFHPKRPQERSLVPFVIERVKRAALCIELGERHRGKQAYGDAGEVFDTFIARGATYFWSHGANSKELEELNLKVPKVSVMQDKVTTILISMAIKNIVLGGLGRHSKAEVFFNLKDILHQLGYKDLDGGKIYREIKKVLFSAANTSYHIKIKKKYEYCSAFYAVERDGVRWRIRFIDKYEDGIIEAALDPRVQATYRYLDRELSDLETLENPRLHMFYQFLLKMRVKKGGSKLEGIKKVLEYGIKVNPGTLKRRDDCADIIARCLSYMAKKYPEDIGGAFFKSTRDSKTRARFSLPELQALKNGQDLMKKLKEIQVTDIREALIGLRHGKEPVLLPEPADIVEEILFCAKENGLKSESEAGAEKILKEALSLPNFSRDDLENDLRRAFEAEKKADHPDFHSFIFSFVKHQRHLVTVKF